jgi:hypothetical protein
MTFIHAIMVDRSYADFWMICLHEVILLIFSFRAL